MLETILGFFDDMLAFTEQIIFGTNPGSYEDPVYVQDTIPVTAIYEDGIFQHGKTKFSKMFLFSDINYALVSRSDKEQIFLKYSELLNSFNSGVTAKITISNRRLNFRSVENNILFPYTGDDLDKYRKEKNGMLIGATRKKNAMTQEKYITVIAEKNDIEEARICFDRIGAELFTHMESLGSECRAVSLSDRLRIFHDFYRTGEEDSFSYDMDKSMALGHDFRDYICPFSMDWKKDYFKIGERYGRVLFLSEYAAFIKDYMIAELTALNQPLMLSIDIAPVPTEQAIKEAENRLLGIETNIANWQRHQNMNNNFSATVPYELEQQKQEMKEFLDDLTTRDQRMISGLLTLVHTADSKEKLDSDTEALIATARRHMCTLSVLKYRQLEGLNTALPFGIREIKAQRTLTTESLAVLMPFQTQEIQHPNGIYYGQNIVSKNPIVVDRRNLLNGNSFILGVSGSGKSFTAKDEITSLVLSNDCDVIVIDPEREYAPLVKALGGEVINISAASNNHINALEINKDYGEGGNPVALKSEFVISLCEQLMGETGLSAKQKSIIDRCTATIYKNYIESNYCGELPTLKEFYAELLAQEEPEAKEVAFAVELFVNGSLNTFAQKSNVATDKRLICYDIFDLGKQLTHIGMLIVLDAIFNRITKNKIKGKSTFIFIDEIYLLFQYGYSANFLFTLWKRVRKLNAYATGITQNVDDLLQSHTARTMLSNSEFIIMLNQATTDREELRKLLNISDRQLSFVTNSDVGKGLMKIGKTILPFENQFKQDTKLYKLLTTKPGE